MGIWQRILSILYNLGHISKPEKNTKNGRLGGIRILCFSCEGWNVLLLLSHKKGK